MRWRVPESEGTSPFWKEPKKIKLQSVREKCLFMKPVPALKQERSFQSPHYLQGISSHLYLVESLCSTEWQHPEGSSSNHPCLKELSSQRWGFYPATSPRPALRPSRNKRSDTKGNRQMHFLKGIHRTYKLFTIPTPLREKTFPYGVQYRPHYICLQSTFIVG